MKEDENQGVMGVQTTLGAKSGKIEKVSIKTRTKKTFQDEQGKSFEADEAFEIAFEFCEARFMLAIYKTGEKWFPGWLTHKSGYRCLFCREHLFSESDCSGGKAGKAEILKTLLKHPLIRLKGAVKFKPLGV